MLPRSFCWLWSLRSINTVLLAFVTQVHAKELAANHTTNAHGSVDQLVHKLIDRLLQARLLHKTDLDDTALWKAQTLESLTEPLYANFRRVTSTVKHPLLGLKSQGIGKSTTPSKEAGKPSDDFTSLPLAEESTPLRSKVHPNPAESTPQSRPVQPSPKQSSPAELNQLQPSPDQISPSLLSQLSLDQTKPEQLSPTPPSSVWKQTKLDPDPGQHSRILAKISPDDSAQRGRSPKKTKPEFDPVKSTSPLKRARKVSESLPLRESKSVTPVRRDSNALESTGKTSKHHDGTSIDSAVMKASRRSRLNPMFVKLMNMVKAKKQREIAQKPSENRTKTGRTFPWGQHSPLSGCCVSTLLTGEPCPGALPLDMNGELVDMVPYCAECRKNGDPSLLVTNHPKFGKILVAKRDLPKGYRMAWWGDLTPKKKVPAPDWEWALVSTKGVINARPYQKGSQLQFSACPGPHEKVTVWMGPRHESNLAKTPLTCLMFSTTMPIPKNHQLCMMYNEDMKSTDEFFEERGIKRADVGTNKFPCIRKQVRTSPLQTKRLQADRESGRRPGLARNLTALFGNRSEDMAQQIQSAQTLEPAQSIQSA